MFIVAINGFVAMIGLKWAATYWQNRSSARRWSAAIAGLLGVFLGFGGGIWLMDVLGEFRHDGDAPVAACDVP